MIKNVKDFPEQERLQSEAASWIAQLDSGVFNDADRLALREWASRSPRHAYELHQFVDSWLEIDEILNESAPCDEAAVSFAGVMGSFISTRPVAFAASVVCFFCAVFSSVYVAANLDSQHHEARFASVIGEQKIVNLPDGSSVHLNTNSMLEIDFNADARIIKLVEGEALFDVKKDRARPFIVVAGDSIVKAIGTTFSVRLNEQDTSVLVAEGVVEVAGISGADGVDIAISRNFRTINDSVQVSQGQAAVLDDSRTEVKSIGTDQVEARLAWQEGLLIFNGDTLEYALGEVARYSDVSIVISDPALKQMKIGGVFPTKDVDRILQALSSSFGIEVRQVSEKVYHLQRAREG